MRNIQHISNNDVLRAPDGVPREECTALFITRVDFGDEGLSNLHTISFWKPDEEELASLAAGRPVMLMVQGTTHPPLALTVESRHAPTSQG